jgi:hypothetical protein
MLPYIQTGAMAKSDAYQCRMMRPDWAKACYHQAAAQMLLKVRQSGLPICLFMLHLAEMCSCQMHLSMSSV